MQDYIDHHYPNGCPLCGGEVIFISSTFTYKCEKCKAFASAHRKHTEKSYMYEPYQRMASPEVNNLRQSLTNIFNPLWQERITINISRGKSKITEEALINVLYSDNIRLINENEYVKVVSPHLMEGSCDVLRLKDNKVLEKVNYTELKSVPNRTKAHIWLADQLGIPIEECHIGYLSEAQLKEAISVCSKNVQNARKKAIDTYQK